MERACAFLFPPIAFALVKPASLTAVSVLALALIACCSTLWVGAAYWRAVWARLENGQSMDDALRMAQRWKPLCLWTSVLSVIASASALLVLGPGAAPLAASGFSILAVLECINYYHVQLQNFDHGPTFRRFLKTRSVPQAHLARDLAVYRAGGEAPIQRRVCAPSPICSTASPNS